MPRKNVEKTCLGCGNTYLASPKQEFCTIACHRRYKEKQLIAEIESKIGESFGKYLRRRYVDEGATIKDIEIELGLADVHRRMVRFLRQYGIEKRTASETVKLTHKRDPSRGKRYGEMCSNPEKRRQMAQGRQKHANLSSIEAAAKSLLEMLGLRPIPHYAVDIYNIDLAIPERMIGIELDGGGWHGTKARKEIDTARDEALVRLGWTIRRFKPNEFDELFHYAESIALTLQDRHLSGGIRLRRVSFLIATVRSAQATNVR